MNAGIFDYTPFANLRKGRRGWWLTPPRPGMHRLIAPWEYRHLRFAGVTRIAGGSVAAAAGIGAGLVLWVLGARVPAAWLWAGTTLVVLAPLAVSVAGTVFRGRPGVDLIALLAMAGGPGVAWLF